MMPGKGHCSSFCWAKTTRSSRPIRAPTLSRRLSGFPRASMATSWRARRVNSPSAATTTRVMRIFVAKTRRLLLASGRPRLYGGPAVVRGGPSGSLFSPKIALSSSFGEKSCRSYLPSELRPGSLPGPSKAGRCAPPRASARSSSRWRSTAGPPGPLCQDSFTLAIRSSMVSALMTWRETCPARCQRNSSIPASFVAPGQKDSKVARMRLIINTCRRLRGSPEAPGPSDHQQT